MLVSLEATRELSRTCLALCEGQSLDLAFEAAEAVSEGEYLAMVEGKTAALLAYSTYVGALAGGASGATVAACHEFGRSLGMAFQMVDDLLGIWGAEEKTGKPVADDIRSRKKTLPIVHAMAQAPPPEREKLAALLSKAELDEDEIWNIRTLLEDVGADGYVRERARFYTAQALEALDATGFRGAARDRLRELALGMIERDR